VKKIIASIIAKDQKELNERVKKVRGYVKTIQLDVMDGKFVPNKSINFKFNKSRGIEAEAHLMIRNPIKWVKENWKKVDTVIVHLETISDAKVIDYIKAKGLKPGIAINPETPIKKLKPYLNKINQVLVMTVNPGFYGSKFLPRTLNKIKELRKLKPRLNIEVDGGISDKTVKQVSKAGANYFCSGSYIQKDAKTAVKKLRELM